MTTAFVWLADSGSYEASGGTGDTSKVNDGSYVTCRTILITESGDVNLDESSVAEKKVGDSDTARYTISEVNISGINNPIYNLDCAFRTDSTEQMNALTYLEQMKRCKNVLKLKYEDSGVVGSYLLKYTENGLVDSGTATGYIPVRLKNIQYTEDANSSNHIRVTMTLVVTA